MGNVKCAVCKKELPSGKAIFRKGKFFCSKKCEARAAGMKGTKDNVCEFC